VGYTQGADLSHWQSDYSFDAVLKWAWFIAIKAGDGTAVASDSEFKERWGQLKSAVQDDELGLRGAYQWLNGSNGTAEADALISAMGDTGKKARGAFDFEDPRATGGELVAAVKRYHEKQGHKSLVYGGYALRVLPSSTRADVAKYADLWLADWVVPYPTISPWKDWTFLQYCGTGLDLDEFNGNRNDLNDYLGIEAPVPEPSIPYPADKGPFVKGMTDYWIGRIANKLMHLGYKKSVFEYGLGDFYGDGKERAVRAFKRDHGLKDNDYIGEATWNELFA
jgi:hypothetical protein